MDWLLSISDERWVDVFTKISLLSAAGFGLLGLLTQYRRKDGTITGWGKIAAVGIVASAALSIASGAFQDRIDAADAKAANDQREEDGRRFRRQLEELGILKQQIERANDTSRELRAKSDKTLKAQERLLSTQNSLLSTSRTTILRMAGLSDAQRKGTDTVMTGLWNETNRIEGGRIELLIKPTCNVNGNETHPALFDKGEATIFLLTADEAQAELQGAFTGWARMSLEERALFSLRRETSEMRGILAEEAQGAMVTRFSPFLSMHPDAISSPNLWSSAHVEIELSADAPPDVDMPTLMAASSKKPNSFPGLHADVRTLPCSADAMLFANGRLVALNTGPVEMSGNVGSARLSVVMPPRPVEPGSLPALGAH